MNDNNGTSPTTNMENHDHHHDIVKKNMNMLLYHAS